MQSDFSYTSFIPRLDLHKNTKEKWHYVFKVNQEVKIHSAVKQMKKWWDMLSKSVVLNARVKTNIFPLLSEEK